MSSPALKSLNSSQLVMPLNDGASMPQLGFGVWQIPDTQAESCVGTALKSGYRSIDTASIYRNEKGVGDAIKASSLARSEIFLTTKLWNDDQGYDAALQAFDESMRKLQTDYVDLYLIHWPAPKKDKYTESWKAVIEVQKQGRARSIGVSNFKPEHLQRLIDETGVVPSVNQIELHPRFQQVEARAFHAKHGIATQSWSPLGQGQVLTDKILTSIAQKHGLTPAQIVIRWHLDSGLIAIPKSATPARIVENFDVFGFTLDADDMARITALDAANGRIGPDPDTADF